METEENTQAGQSASFTFTLVADSGHEVTGQYLNVSPEQYRQVLAALGGTLREMPAEPGVLRSWHLEGDAVRNLAACMGAGFAESDEPTEIVLSVGWSRNDDGAAEFGLRVHEAEYPEEGVVPLVECRPGPGEPQHPDDAAVDLFAALMKQKLRRARIRGRMGWQLPSWTPAQISAALRGHVEKGDPVDVANYCMFLALRGARIESGENGNG